MQLKIQSAPSFQAHGPLSFISKWKPALRNPDLEMSQISVGGYKELHDMGYTYRTVHPLSHHTLLLRIRYFCNHIMEILHVGGE